jgi:hypothetical protein
MLDGLSPWHWTMQLEFLSLRVYPMRFAGLYKSQRNYYVRMGEEARL